MKNEETIDLDKYFEDLRKNSMCTNDSRRTVDGLDIPTIKFILKLVDGLIDDEGKINRESLFAYVDGLVDAGNLDW